MRISFRKAVIHSGSSVAEWSHLDRKRRFMSNPLDVAHATAVQARPVLKGFESCARQRTASAAGRAESERRLNWIDEYERPCREYAPAKDSLVSDVAS